MRRDFIPEGEPLSPAEQARAARAIPSRTDIDRRDFIPPKGWKSEGSTPDDRARIAEEAATRRMRRAEANEREAATLKLQRLSAQHAVEFVESLSDRSKRIYAEVELAGQARGPVLAALKAYLPEEPAQPEQPVKSRTRKPRDENGTKE